MTQQGQGDVVGRSSEWTFTDCLKVAQAGYGEWALNPRNDSATEHLAGTVIISDMMACIAEAFRRALADAPLSSCSGEQGWRTIDSAPKGEDVLLAIKCEGENNATVEIGMLLFETDPEGEAELDGKRGDWRWSVGNDWQDETDYAGDDLLLGWQPVPSWRTGTALSAPGSVPTSQSTTINSALRKLADVWELDGDLMRCRGCGRALIASRGGEQLHHSAECKHSERGHPWAELRNLLGSVPTSLAGDKGT